MERILLLLVITSTAFSQSTEDISKLINDVFVTPSGGRNSFDNLVEVTSPASQGFSAIEKCGEGSDEGIHKCVRYYECDGVTKMIVPGGTTNIQPEIDIRMGEDSPCAHPLEVCCGIPAGGDPNQQVSTTTSAPVTPRPSSVKCGIRNVNGIDFKITGNMDGEAEYGEFPWMVAILRTNPAPGETLSICGGSLIANNVVLTGGHCVSKLKTIQYKVRAGEWDTQTDKERLPYQERNVVQAIIHPEFTENTVYNDIALLVLDRPFTQADNIGTVCLPEQGEVSTSANCYASGWGKDVFGKEGKFQVIMKKIELPMVQFSKCQDALRQTRLGPKFLLHNSFICAGGEAGKDTCTGDGGSPLVCPDTKVPGRYYQSGIVSWGIGCGEKNVPGVYANVAKFRNWIDTQMAGLNLKTDSYII
ncbi:hypothetical protein GWI33_022889 [Rhynchophorus ferrugineus]|uniref:Phenoloxidase-activating factor 2 n=1 Tax=Rhynchophorus ferrugineus TaxID=354439 RepID=A0A834ITX0_RHYFE|nr:hypothetical protein GWI33_022889 [Rhynchophorus ferrugineus]